MDEEMYVYLSGRLTLVPVASIDPPRQPNHTYTYHPKLPSGNWIEVTTMGHQYRAFVTAGAEGTMTDDQRPPVL